MIVRELYALFGFQVDKQSAGTVDKQIGGFISKLKGLAAVASTIGAAVVLKGIAESVGRAGDELDTAAQRLGIGTQALQELRFAADRADVSQEELGAGLRILSRNAFEAANGNKELTERFRRAGIELRDGLGKVKTGDVLLRELADGTNALGDENERLGLVLALAGRSATALIPLLKLGSKNMDEQAKRAQALGDVLDTALIQQASAWDDSQKDVASTLKGIRNAIGKGLLPVLTMINRAWAKLIETHGVFVRTTITTALESIGQLVGGVARSLLTVADVTLSWVGGLSKLNSEILGVTTGIIALVALLALPGGPLLVLLALIGLIIEDFMVWREGGESVIGDLVASLKMLGDQFPWLRELLGGVVDGFLWLASVITDYVGGAIAAVLAGLQFLVEFFTLGPAQAAKNLLAIWGEMWLALGKPVVEAVDFWKTKIEEVLNWIASKIPGVSKLLGGFGGGIGNAALDFFAPAGGKAPANLAAAPAAAALPGATRNMANSQTNNVSIAVDARGVSDPQAVGDIFDQRVEAVLERQNRNVLSTFAIAGG